MTTRRILWAGLTVAITLWTTPAAGMTPEAAQALAKLRELNRVEDSAVGYAASPSTVYALYEKLRQGASRKELTALLEDKCPAVRVYALWGLKAKFPETDVVPILLARLDDSQMVNTLFGCIGDRESVADVMADHVYPDLTPAERMKLLDGLLTRPGKVRVQQQALSERPLPRAFHARIRTLARTGSPGSVTALASYNDPADVPVVLERLKNPGSEPGQAQDAFQAAAECPNAAFLPVLGQRLADSFRTLDRSDDPASGWLFRAVAAHKTPEAAQLLHAALSLPAGDPRRPYALSYASSAAVLNAAPCYTGLLQELFEAAPLPQFYGMTLPTDPPPFQAVLESLYQADPARTVRMLRLRFSRPDFETHDAQAVAAMRDFLFARLKAAEAWEIFNLPLANPSPMHIEGITAFALKHKSATTLPLLVGIAATTKDPGVKSNIHRGLASLGPRPLDDAIAPLLKSGVIPAAQWQTVRASIWSADSP